MRLCANENISEDCVSRLRKDGHDVVWIRETGPGSTENDVLACAAAEKRLLITFDKDFGDLVFRRGAKASPGRWTIQPGNSLRNLEVQEAEFHLSSGFPRRLIVIRVGFVEFLSALHNPAADSIRQSGRYRARSWLTEDRENSPSIREPGES
jgi:predicted nuclease of predicted toxin-antitoxin system